MEQAEVKEVTLHDGHQRCFPSGATGGAVEIEDAWRRLHRAEEPTCWAKAWFDYFSAFLAEELGYEACKAVLLVHVDDVMGKGNYKYFHEEFVPKVRSKFAASFSTMTKVGEKISFLKRTYQRLDDGILITPGHYIENMMDPSKSRTSPWN